MYGLVIYKQYTKHIGLLNHSVIVIIFVSAQSDHIKRRTMYIVPSIQLYNLHLCLNIFFEHKNCFISHILRNNHRFSAFIVKKGTFIETITEWRRNQLRLSHDILKV
jgi:hypothetical protein